MMELRKILLAEDNAKDAELTLEALRENNFANEVVLVRDGVEAVEYLTRRGEYENRKPGMPAVVILDVKMPRMDGIEALSVIRNTPELKFLPVVMLTSSRQEKDMVASYDLGVNAYVVKPVGLTDFIEVIRQLGMFWGVINLFPNH